MSVAVDPITAARLGVFEVIQRRHLPSPATLWQPHDYQIPPDGDWRIWLLLAGRGAGKSRAGSEWVRQQIEAGKRRIALVAPTAADARDVMVEGDSGIMSVCHAARPLYEPSKRRLTWPNGAIATTYSADEPERLRGPQFDAAYVDEPGSWRYPAAWDNLMLGLRLGSDPRCVVTGTPRPTTLMRDLLARDGQDVVVTRATTYANRANLAPQFLAQVLARYEGTRLGRQEIGGEMLEDVEGALWTLAQLDAGRVAEAPETSLLVVGVDPATTAHEGSDETGIVVAGRGIDGAGYVLADRSCRLSPHGWAQRAVAAYHEYECDRIIAEANNGGEMVRLTIQTVDPDVPVTLVHASRGKRTRAEPVAALYEQDRCHHVGMFPELEDQMITWTPQSGQSPDRLDALVWALTYAMLDQAGDVTYSDNTLYG